MLRSLTMVTSLASAAALGVSGIAQAQVVGTAAAVNPASTARLGGTVRTVTIGADIAHKERITTTAAGSVQLLFVDKTTMTVGPNSDLTIDEYVFDPNANTGKLAARLTKGVMRFVGGQISHNGEATVSTPSAVIGIRGGSFVAQVMPGGQTQTIHMYGNQSFSSGGQTQTLSAPGWTTNSAGAGNTPAPPAPATQQQIAAVNQQFQAQSGQTGGTGGSVNNQTVTTSLNTAGGGGASGGSSTPPPTETTSQQTQTNNHQRQLATVFESVNTASQSSVVNTIAQIQKKLYGASPFAMTATTCCAFNGGASPIPFVPAAFATPTGAMYVSPIVGYRNSSAEFTSRAAFMQYGINIQGVGSSQSSWFYLMTGAAFSSTNDNTGPTEIAGGFVASRRGASNLGVGIAAGALGAYPDYVSVDSQTGFVNDAAVTSLNYVRADRSLTPQPSFYFLGDGTSSQNYTFVQRFEPAAVPAGLGDNRPAALASSPPSPTYILNNGGIGSALIGFSGGVMRTVNTTLSINEGSPFNVAGSVVLQLNPATNRMQFNVETMAQGNTGTYQTAAYQLGNLNTSLNAHGSYVDFENFGARAAKDANDNSLALVNGGAVTSHRAGMVNVSRPVAQQIISQFDPVAAQAVCVCDYTRWGLWSQESSRTNINNETLSDRGNMMFWVAGRPSGVADIPATGSATYAGHVVANVATGGTQYIAAGQFANTVNFQTGTTTMAATLDNASYAGNLTNFSNPTVNAAGYTGTLNQVAGSRTMAVEGLFYQGSQNRIGETGGRVLVNGPGYNAAGIFAGRCTSGRCL